MPMGFPNAADATSRLLKELSEMVKLRQQARPNAIGLGFGAEALGIASDLTNPSKTAAGLTSFVTEDIPNFAKAASQPFETANSMKDALMRLQGVPGGEIASSLAGGIREGISERGLLGVADPTDAIPGGKLLGALGSAAMIPGKIAKATPDISNVKLFHGGPNRIAKQDIFNDPIEPMKFGLFTSQDKEAAASHIMGKGQISEFDIPENKIASSSDLGNIAASKVESHLSKRFPDATSDELDEIYDVLIGESDSEVLEEVFDRHGMLMEGHSGEVDWIAQRERGRLAWEMGFDAVEMGDEHGTSILLLPERSVGALGSAAMIPGKIAKRMPDLNPRQKLLRELQESQGGNLGALERARLEGKASALKGIEGNDLMPGPASRPDEFVKIRDAMELGPKLGGISREEGLERIKALNELTLPTGLRKQIEGFDNLPDQELARLDRAVQQGFELDAFHGTKGDIESFDPGLLGATTGAPSARVGFFFSADPKTARTYASQADVAEVNPKAVAEVERLKVKLADNPDEVMALDQFKAEALGRNIIPVKLRLQNPLVHDFAGEGYRDVSYRELLEQAKRDGKDGVIFKNTRDGGPVTDIYVVFEPSQIRSRFAAFDPKDAPKISADTGRIDEIMGRFSKAGFGIDGRNIEEAKELIGMFSDLEMSSFFKGSDPIKDLDELKGLLAKSKSSGDILAGFTPVLLPVGGGAAAAAFSANQEAQ
tara:strand:- start:1647 stop:3791 length:2145 start_codon:yes stop_codon:yes gene_type:complete